MILLFQMWVRVSLYSSDHMTAIQKNYSRNSLNYNSKVKISRRSSSKDHMVQKTSTLGI
jgi:hypothetical protein